MRTAKCPTCGKDFEFENAGQQRAIPFCSARCKQIDLGRWLGGSFVIPGRPLEEEDLADGAIQPDDGEE